MPYQKSEPRKTAPRNSSVGDAVALKKGLFAPAVPALQKQAEEEELQMKRDPAQLMAEEEEPMQGKFITQLQADEEEMQMKKDPAQLMGEEEEPLQGKFVAQKQGMEEEEPMQGKFITQLQADEEEMQMKKEPAQLMAEEEEPMQGKFVVQKQGMEEEEPMQGKFDPVQKKKSGNSAFQLKADPSHTSTQTAQLQEDNSKRANNTGMPSSLKAGIESLSGLPMDDVRVHYNSDKPKQLKAHAYAQGTDIHLAPGQEKHLPHEAWHIAQQKQGRVQATMQMKGGVPVNDDQGLETEADVMGAKAAARGEVIQNAQLKSIRRSSAGIFQRKVAQRSAESEAQFQKDNAPMINMITHSASVLATIPWKSLAAGSDNVGTAATVTGIAGSVTGLAGTATNEIKGEAKPDLEKAAGDITKGIGSSIGALVHSVRTIKHIYQTASGKEDALIGSGDMAISMMSALKSGFDAAGNIQKFVSGSVPGYIVSLVPGLGIAIAGCEIIKNAFITYNAHQAKADMNSVSEEFRANLEGLIGPKPEKNKPSLFADEKRGKFGSRVTYMRLKPGLLETLNSLLDPDLSQDTRDKMAVNFKRIHKIPENVSVPELISAIKFYELGSKMEEINQKRKVQGARSIFLNILSLAGEIAKFFPADGGVTAGVLLGASAGVGAALSAGKFIQGVARNHAIMGGDSNRSDKAKHKEYVNHTRTIYEFLNAINQPVTEAEKPKVTRGEQILRATGVNMNTVLGTDYNNTESVTRQVNLIVDAMKAGR